MNIDQIQGQAAVLHAAADESPIVTWRSMLRARANELDQVVKAWKQAAGDEIPEDQLEIVSMAMIERGSRIYWPNLGPGRVMRTTPTGIQLELDAAERGEPEWVNVSSNLTPLVACP